MRKILWGALGTWLLTALLLGMTSAVPLTVQAPDFEEPVGVAVRQEVVFMRRFIAEVNPSLPVEDPQCALRLPPAILRHAESNRMDWRKLLALAWQESDFDCHAKNRRDKGGAYGPFQIRRLWKPVIGDPRPRYFDPELAVQRVVQVIRYYKDTPRYRRLVERRFRNPVLCLYNTGETRRVNMSYCRQIGRKLELVEAAWQRYQAQHMAESWQPAPPTASTEREGTAPASL